MTGDPIGSTIAQGSSAPLLTAQDSFALPLSGRMPRFRAAGRLDRESARKMVEERSSRRWRCKTKSGEPRLAEHGGVWLSDLYEPYLLLQEMSGNHLAETSKLRPEWRLGCCTLQLDFPRRSGTYSDPKFNRIVVKSTLLHFSSESGPSGNSKNIQISRKLNRLLRGARGNTIENLLGSKTRTS